MGSFGEGRGKMDRAIKFFAERKWSGWQVVRFAPFFFDWMHSRLSSAPATAEASSASRRSTEPCDGDSVPFPVANRRRRTADRTARRRGSFASPTPRRRRSSRPGSSSTAGPPPLSPTCLMFERRRYCQKNSRRATINLTDIIAFKL